MADLREADDGERHHQHGEQQRPPPALLPRQHIEGGKLPERGSVHPHRDGENIRFSSHTLLLRNVTVPSLAFVSVSTVTAVILVLTRTFTLDEMAGYIKAGVNSSLVPFAVRRQLVQAGVAHLPNVICHDSGPYMISNATFPSYFLRDEAAVIDGHARLDIAVFTQIAAALGITARYVGEEPASLVTAAYNRVMCEKLPKAGIDCVIIPRREAAGTPISASTVRRCLQRGDWAALRTLVPQTTYDYFTSPAAAHVLAKLRSAGNVAHY